MGFPRRMLVFAMLGVGLGGLPPAVPSARAQEAGWPSWRGPFHSGSAGEVSEPLVDDPRKARRIWTSDEEIPGARVGDGRGVRVATGLPGISGGFASPVMADGRVFLSYYIPNGEGDAYWKAAVERHEPAGGYGREKWWIDTDDVIHAFDAATGRTLWKRVFPREGMNYNLFNKGGPCNLTPVVRDGRVYAVGSAGKVYCVDAATGEPIWDSDVGERYRRQMELKRVCKEQQVIPQYNRDKASAPVVAAGVLVTSDFLGYKVQTPVREFNWGDGSGLVGFDARTGERLWHLPRTLGNWATPVVWRHGGREYVVAGTRSRISCVEPRSGRVLWEIPSAEGQTALTVGDDHLLIREEETLAAYRLTPEGPERAWILTRAAGSAAAMPVIHGGHVYAVMSTGRTLCIDLATGRIRAEIAAGAQAGGRGFLVAMGDRLFSQGGRVIMINPDPHAFASLGGPWSLSNATGYMNPIIPAFADGRVYARSSEGRLVAYDLRAAHAHAEPQVPEGEEVEIDRPVAAPVAPAARTGPPPPTDPFAEDESDPLDDLLDGRLF